MTPPVERGTGRRDPNEPARHATRAGPAAGDTNRWPRPGSVAPPERLAAVRILTGGFAIAYLAVRAPVILAVRDRAPGTFSPVGVLWWLDRPLPDAVVVTLLAAIVARKMLKRIPYMAVAMVPGVGIKHWVCCGFQCRWRSQRERVRMSSSVQPGKPLMR